MNECKGDIAYQPIQLNQSVEALNNPLLFSEKFLHSGALKLKAHSVNDIENEIVKISRLFDSIFYLKHFENRVPATNIADEIINIIKENVFDSGKKNLLKIKGPLGSYKNRLLQYIYICYWKSKIMEFCLFILICQCMKSQSKKEV